jgi:hypothetical protein
MLMRTYAGAARAISLVLAAWLWLLPAAAARGQEAVPTPTAEAPEARPGVIPIGEIAIRAEVLEDRIDEFEFRLSDAALERRVEEGLVEIEAEIASVQTRLEATLARRHGPTELETLAASWQNLDARLASDEAAIGERASQLATWLLEVRDATERWRQTRAAARGAAAPDRVLSLAAEVLRELRAVEGELQASQKAALDLQGRVVERRRLVAAGLKRVDAMRDQLAASLLVRQDDPLWRAHLTDEEIREELGETRRDLAEIGTQLGEHASRHRERFILQALLVLGLAWGLSRARAVLRRHAAFSEVTEAGSLPLEALEHPWAAALLVGTLATPVLHPERVLGLQIAVLLASIPVWVLVLRPMLPAALRAPLVGLAALALADVVRLVVGGFELLAQGLLLAEFAAGLLGTLWLRKPERLRQLSELVGRSFWLRVLAGWLPLALVGFGIGLIAALLGYSNLAARMSLLAIWGSYLGAAVVAGVRIVEAIAQSALLARRPGGLRMLRPATVLVGPGGAAVGPGARRCRDRSRGPRGVRLVRALARRPRRLRCHPLAFVAAGAPGELRPRPGGLPARPDGAGCPLRAHHLQPLHHPGDRLPGCPRHARLLPRPPGPAAERTRRGHRLRYAERGDASRVRTFDGADVIVPNGDLISARVVNWTLSDRKRRVTIPVGVAYGTRPRKVLEILQQVAGDHPEVLDDPAPESLFRGFGENSLDFELRAFTESERGWLPVTSDLAVAITEALETAGITIPFPQRDLHLQNVRELGDALANAVGGHRRPDSDRRG